MRRPMIFTSLAFGGGVCASYYLAAARWVWILFFTGALVFFVYTAMGDRKKSAFTVSVFLILFFMGGLWMGLRAAQQDPLLQYEARTIETAGLVTDTERGDDSCKLAVENEESRILVSCYGAVSEHLDEKALEGEWVELKGKVVLPQQRRNPRCFDYRLFLRSCGIQVQMTAEEIVLLPGKTDLFVKMTADIRNTFEEKLETSLEPEAAGIGIAMLFGDKTGLDEKLYEDFQKNGTAHILAVSGLHIGILYAFLSFLWKGKKGCVYYLVAAGILLLYTALADFSPSVVRASVMIALHLLANLLHRRYDLLSAAGFAFCLMLLANPFQLFHAGFQLSFLAIASLGIILPFAEKLYQGIFLSSFVIQVGMLPYTAWLFNSVSLGAFIANVPVIFFAGLLLPVGICMIFFAYCSEPLFVASAAFFEQGCRILIAVNDLFYAEGRTSFDVVSPPLFFLICYYGALFLLVSEKGRVLMIRKKTGTIVLWLSVIVVLASLSFFADNKISHADITFVDVGQGDCIHVRTEEGKNYLIDGGGSFRYDVGKKIVKPYLLKNGIRKLDAVFLTHLHKDHYGGIRSLAREGMIKKIGVYEANRCQEARLFSQTKTAFFYLSKGERVILGKEVYLDILAPEKKTEAEYQSLIREQGEENASCLIMKLVYKDTAVLITGDIDEDGERDLINRTGKEELCCDLLKIAHHGSKYSTCEAFLECVAPKIAVFQVGKNNFGHPSETVIEKCRQKGIMIYRNDTSGAIGLFAGQGGRGISIYKMIE